MIKTFKSPLWIRVFCAGAFMLFVSGFAWKLMVEEWDRWAFAWASFSVIGLLGLLDSMTCHVHLNPDGIEIIANFRKRNYAKSDVEGVSWANGVGARLKLRDGKSVELPEVGKGSNSLTASIRNWLKGHTDAV